MPSNVKRSQKAALRDKQGVHSFNNAIGVYATKLGPQEVCRDLLVTESKARYWRDKLAQPEFKIGGRGGARRGFSPEKSEAVGTALRTSLDRCPYLTVRDLVTSVEDSTGHRVSETFIKKFLKDVNWTYVSILMCTTFGSSF